RSAGQFRSHVFASVGSHSSPQGNFRPKGPRAAFSHSASVGTARPAHSQNAVASSKLTWTTGCFPRGSGMRSQKKGTRGGGTRFVAATNARYSSQVVEHRPIQ